MNPLVLGAADLAAVLEASSVLAAEPTPDIAAALDVVRSLVPSTSASFNDMTLATADYRYVISPPDAQELAARLKPVYDRLAHQHPLIAAAEPNSTRGALRFCDVPGGAQFEDSDLYREFFRPFGLRYQLVIQLPSPPDVVVGYALNRSMQQGEFSDRDVAVLNAIGPHLAMHHRRTIDFERRRAMAAEVDHSGGWEVLVVRSDGVVEASSSRSSSSLAPGDRVPSEVTGLLPSWHEYGTRRHDVMVGKDRWRCVVYPVPTGPTTLLVRKLGEEAPEATPLIDLGLTPRQTEVALELVRRGGTNLQLARSLGISEGTLKKHLEAVFRVLGVDNRAAAIVALGAAGG